MSLDTVYRKVVVEVTPDDIVQHVPYSNSDCAFSRALYRALGGEVAVDVIVGRILLVGARSSVTIATDRQLNDWIMAIDQGRAVPPISRTIEIPATFFEIERLAA